MTPFQQATIPPEEVQRLRQALLDKLLAQPEQLQAEFGRPDPTPGAVLANIDQLLARELHGLVFRNDLYQVRVREHNVGGNWPEMLELSIRRLDRKPIRDWRHFQRIKDELVGPEHEAVELYPAQERLVDSANQFWLYVLRDPTIRFPFGMWERTVAEGTVGKSQQRPFGEELAGEKGASV